MPHIDIPGGGSFGTGDFISPEAVMRDAMDELDEENALYDRKQAGNVALSPVLSSLDQDRPSRAGFGQPDEGGFPPSPLPAGPGPLPSVIGGGSPPFQDAPPSGGYQPLPGGRPPGYDVGGTLPGPGSRSRAAASLLAAAGAGAALGFYTKDPRGAAVGFLGAGSAINLMRGRTLAASPVPEQRIEGTMTTGAALVGLGICAYFGYGLYKEAKKK